MATTATIPGSSTTSKATSSATDKASKSLNQNFDNFIKLLTTQLQNQDPTSPMDTNALTQQIIGFSQVEQSIQTNKSLDSLIAATKETQISNAVSYIDKEIETESGSALLKNGSAKFSYTLDANAIQTSINISTDTGRVVFSTGGKTAKGKYDFAWDGKDANGNQLKDGVYNISVISKDSKGAAIATKTYAVGTVTGVNLNGEETTISMDGLETPLNKVIGIRTVKTTTTQATTGSKV